MPQIFFDKHSNFRFYLFYILMYVYSIYLFNLFILFIIFLPQIFFLAKYSWFNYFLCKKILASHFSLVRISLGGIISSAKHSYLKFCPYAAPPISKCLMCPIQSDRNQRNQIGIKGIKGIG